MLLLLLPLVVLLVLLLQHHTAERHYCLHGMPRFHITSAQDGDFVPKANSAV